MLLPSTLSKSSLLEHLLVLTLLLKLDGLLDGAINDGDEADASAACLAKTSNLTKNHNLAKNDDLSKFDNPL